MIAASAGESIIAADSARQHGFFVGVEQESGTPVTVHSAETLLAINKECNLPSTTIIRDCWGCSVRLHNDGLTHHSVDRSVDFVAQGSSQI
jgi:hypothetical protein